MKKKSILKDAGVLLIVLIMVLSTVMIVAGNASTGRSTWYIETVDGTGDVGVHTSIALDSSNNPHISYHDDTNQDLKYAHYDGSWNIETVDSAGYVGPLTSIALDSSNNPHISYYDVTNYDLRYAYNDGSWNIEKVDFTGNVGVHSSIALDSSNNPHISYNDGGHDDLKYAYNDGSWNIETVDSIGLVGSCTSIALDSSNNPHISYFDDTNKDLKYATTAEHSPNKPTIDGANSGKAGTSYNYNFMSTDPGGDDVSYYIEWGDESTTTWTTFQPSGSPGYSESHTWDTQGEYKIRAKAKDTNGLESDWAELSVTMPRNRAIQTPFLNFLQQYPILYQLLQRLLQL